MKNPRSSQFTLKFPAFSDLTPINQAESQTGKIKRLNKSNKRIKSKFSHQNQNPPNKRKFPYLAPTFSHQPNRNSNQANTTTPQNLLQLINNTPRPKTTTLNQINTKNTNSRTILGEQAQPKSNTPTKYDSE